MRLLLLLATVLLSVTCLAGPVRVACLGDSITEGTVLKDREHTSYPAVLASQLGPEYEVRNFGRSGATVTSQGEGALPYTAQPQWKEALDWNPQLVVLMLGTNDTKPAVFEEGVRTFSDSYQYLIDRLQQLPSKPRIVLCLPVPVFGAGRFSINEPKRQELLPQISSLAKSNRLELLDFAALLGSKPEWFPDLVHPNAEATAEMAREIARKISQPVSR